MAVVFALEDVVHECSGDYAISRIAPEPSFLRTEMSPTSRENDIAIILNYDVVWWTVEKLPKGAAQLLSACAEIQRCAWHN